MKFIKKYEKFIVEEAEIAEPTTKPDVKPTTKPKEKPGKPGPFRKDRESPVPAPAKAGLKTATAEDVAKKFIALLNQSGDDVKKYIEKK